jgi:hypothetical protein
LNTANPGRPGARLRRACQNSALENSNDVHAYRFAGECVAALITVMPQNSYNPFF